MKPNYRKSLEGYIRLLKIFERELKVYHRVFANNCYKINYIIKRERYTNDVEIRIVLTILRQSLWKYLIDEPENLKKILENYCAYFSVTDITIVRPVFFQNRHTITQTSIFIIPPIEERVSFDLFMYESTWRAIQ